MIEAEPLRICLRDPIPEIFEAAQYLQEAVSAHLKGNTDLAEELFRRADMPAIRDWSESLWGKNKRHRSVRVIENAPPSMPREQRIGGRMPSTAIKKALLERDGYHCRFCGMPVIRETIRRRIKAVYSDALPWEGTNLTQHAAFQAMWVQYDHLLPHARGGDHSLDNMVITCAPCNFGRMNYLLAEIGLTDPRTREPIRSTWDGLERFTPFASTKKTRATSSRITREAFLTSCSPDAAEFYCDALGRASGAGLLISWTPKGFNIRQEGHSAFLYAYPPGVSGRVTAELEYYVRDLPPSVAAEFRSRLSQLRDIRTAGQHTLKIPITSQALPNAYKTLDVAFHLIATGAQ